MECSIEENSKPIAYVPARDIIGDGFGLEKLSEGKRWNCPSPIMTRTGEMFRYSY